MYFGQIPFTIYKNYHVIFILSSINGFLHREIPLYFWNKPQLVTVNKIDWG